MARELGSTVEWQLASLLDLKVSWRQFMALSIKIGPLVCLTEIHSQELLEIRKRWPWMDFSGGRWRHGKTHIKSYALLYRITSKRWFTTVSAPQTNSKKPCFFFILCFHSFPNRQRFRKGNLTACALQTSENWVMTLEILIGNFHYPHYAYTKCWIK